MYALTKSTIQVGLAADAVAAIYVPKLKHEDVAHATDG